MYGYEEREISFCGRHEGYCKGIKEFLRARRLAKDQDVAKFSRYRNTTDTMDGSLVQFEAATQHGEVFAPDNLVQFELLSRSADDRMGGGCSFRDASTATLCMGGAMLPYSQKALALAAI